MRNLFVIKIGGNVVDNPSALASFLDAFSGIHGYKILVHGGGKKASALAERLSIPVRMHEGRRITDAETLDIAVMVYAGLINKQLVAALQARQCTAIGICGADGGCVPAKRRPVAPIDFGLVGDIYPETVDAGFFSKLLHEGFSPVFAPLTHDGNGQLLNTNADSVASAIAVALSGHFLVHLVYCFEKKGVLQEMDDENSLITDITPESYTRLRAEGIVRDGMIPKLDNAFAAIQQGVRDVVIGAAANLAGIVAGEKGAATRIHE